MADKNIKGIVIEIGGDTTGLDKALKSVNDRSIKLSQELKKVDTLLKFNPGNTELIAQKQKILADQLTATADKLKQLKDAQSQVDEQFRKGEIGEEQYRAFQREVVATQGALDGLKNKLNNLAQEQENLTKSSVQLETLLKATGLSAEQLSSALGDKLTKAILNGTASSRQLEDALEKVGKEALGTNIDLDKMKKALAQVDDGDSIDKVKKDLQNMSKEAEQSETSVKGLGNELASLAGGLVAGGGIAGAVSQALDLSSLNTQIDITFDVPEESKQSVKDAVRGLQAYGVDAEAALEGVRRQWALNKDASDEVNAAIVKGAASISRSYSGIDFTELIQEVNEIGKELNISDEEALALTNHLLKVGFPPEQIDIISEYGHQLKQAGYSAEEIQGIFAAGIDTGTWNIDSLLDGLKEGRIRLAELGRGLSSGLKDALKEYTGDAKAVSDAELSQMQANFSKTESSLQRSLDKRYDAVSKSHDKQRDSLEKVLDDEYESVADNYDKQQSELEKALEKEYEAAEKAAEKKIALIDKEYTEKLKLIDEEKYNQIKSIESQIEGLNGLSDAEDKAVKEKENAERRAELKARAASADTSKERQEALKDLADFDEKLRLEKIQAERKEQIEALRKEKDQVNDAFSLKKDALKVEADERKKAADEESKENLKTIKEAHQNELQAFRDLTKQKLDDLKDEQEKRKSILDERLDNELDSVKAAHDAELQSFKAMNDEKLKLAKEPPDSAAFKAMEGQITAWGKAVAKGGEEGSKAMIEVAEWLNTIDDATLQNAIGVEIFGTMFEDQGQNIIDTLLNAENATFDLSKGILEVQQNTEKWSTDPATKLKQAIESIKKSLGPLLKVIADVVAAIATWASENSTLASIITAVVSAVGILTGAFLALQPVFELASKLFPFLQKILPLVGRAFTALTGPIGLVVTALIIAVPLIIKNWEPISEFFINLWDGIKNVFFSAIDGISNFLSKSWSAIQKVTSTIFGALKEFFVKWGPDLLAILTGPIGLLVKTILKNWDTIKQNTSTVFNKIKDSMVSPIENAKSLIKSMIDSIKGFFSNLKLSFPKIKMPKLPKFSLDGEFNLYPPEVPRLKVDWFDKGGVFYGPQVIGVGEKRPEFVGALDDLRKIVREEVGQDNVNFTFTGPISVRNDNDIKLIARELFNLQESRRRAAGRA